MSLKTWKQEFYPITALQAHKTLDLIGLIKHSLQKWEGLKPKNLKKHDVKVYGLDTIADEDEHMFEVDAHTCALCRRFVNFHEDQDDKDCIGCPIYESRGQVRCYDYMTTEKTHDSPYGMWIWEENPLPMLKALRKALKWAEKNS